MGNSLKPRLLKEMTKILSIEWKAKIDYNERVRAKPLTPLISRMRRDSAFLQVDV